MIGTAFFRSTARPATFTTSALSAARHSITAVYLGGTTFNQEEPINWAPSTSPAIDQVVTGPVST
ncbi:hypothetical protein GCM10010151_57200 [Actinoallomurus spadix]|uniref:Uncharacterized protein n=1 Tax=Actinoallomurus spadix TaxID=79912 RepID=A0ABN0XBC8_9ACTN